MEELFNMLSSSARLDKSSRKNKRQRSNSIDKSHLGVPNEFSARSVPSRDRTRKRDMSEDKRKQVHKEQMASFRNSMSIKIANKHDPDLPDAISSFDEIAAPSWWKIRNIQTNERNGGNDNEADDLHSEAMTSFLAIARAVQNNIEDGRWKEPTPIQMQSIPTLLERRDLVASAPTGSGKSGAFIIPAIFLSGAPYHIYFSKSPKTNHLKKKIKSTNKTKQSRKDEHSKHGEIRALLLAPSRELAVQLHREVGRLGMGKLGGISTLLLSKSNVAQVISGSAGGKSGLDVLVTTPLRLVDALDKGLRLDSVRLVVLDEADRLLDAADGKSPERRQNHYKNADSPDSEPSRDEDDSERKQCSDSGDDNEVQTIRTSGSSQTKTFLAQMDRILSVLPSSAVRGLFSATVTPTVKYLSENILRNPVDLTISSAGSSGGANTDIEQELMFVGREEGKLLALRQLKERGQLKPPLIVFVQSQERAQALFAEILYDGMRVDVIHAGRSQTARDNAVAKFRKGETWVLICTDLVARGIDFRAVNMVINYDLPTSGITYVHRIGRTGRAGRKGKAITLFTEADFENLRVIANIMKQSGCKVEDWMLQLKRPKRPSQVPRHRGKIDSIPRYDKKLVFHKRQMIEESKRKKKRVESESNHS